MMGFNEAGAGAAPMSSVEKWKKQKNKRRVVRDNVTTKNNPGTDDVELEYKGKLVSAFSDIVINR